MSIRKESARKRKIVIVGAIRGNLEDGRIGGQTFACRSLMGSRLALKYDIKSIDSSVNSVRSIADKPGLLRALFAAKRLVKFTWLLVIDRPLAAILFASHSLSFLEKGVMTLLARVLGIRVLLLPRSGHLVTQVGRYKIFAAFTSFVLKSASLTICQSASWQQFFSHLTSGQGRFRVVENWLPNEAFVTPDAEVSSSGGGHFVVGYFNRIEEDKGIYDFIEAVRLASCQMPSLRAVIYGDGSCVERVRSRIVELNLQTLVEFKGWLRDRDKLKLLRQLDAYIFCSHVEGFPNSLLEVLAMKVPILSVRVGSVPDVIDDGVTGLLVDIKDVKAIANNIILLAQDSALRCQLAQGAYARVGAINTLEQAVRSIEEALA